MTRKKPSSEAESTPTLFPVEEKQSTLIKDQRSKRKVKKVVLIDANSLIHRAFHALPLSLRNSKGEIVNAAFGFAGMLVKVIREFEPDAIIAAFDTKEPTFRHEVFKEYKANRLETADELIPQFKLVKKILASFNIPIIEKPGYEADDILASLAVVGQKAGKEVYILSGDRDMLQLVDQNIWVIATRKGVSEVKIYDREKVFERFGVYPEEIPDFLALKGESSDNVPGVPGIGEKTAAQLIREYGKLENLYSRLEDLKGKKFYQSLKDSRESVFKARELVTLRRDLSVEKDLLERPLSYDKAVVARVFTELEFQSLLKRLDLEGIEPEIGFEPAVEAIEANVAQVMEIIQKEKEAFIGIVDGKIVVAGDNFYAWITDAARLIEFFENADLIFVNDLKALYKLFPKGRRPFLEKELRARNVNDLSLLLWLSNPDRKKYNLTDYVPNEKLAAQLPAFLEWGKKLLERIREEGMEKVYREVELPMAVVLAEMEEAGLPVDTERLYDLNKELERRIEETERLIFSYTGVKFNLDSPKQLAYVLYDLLKIKPPARARKKLSTDQATLLKLINAHPVIEAILNYRELTKLKRTYVEPFLEKVDPQTKRVYGRFIQTGTATGRLASEDPNLQNLPLKGSLAQLFREAIRCSPGKIFVAADYANIDLRVLAHLSGDNKLQEAFLKNEDIHLKTAVEVLKVDSERVDERLRRIAKAINFGIIYGVTPEGLAEQAAISIEEARRYIDNYFEKYPGVKRYLETTIKQAYEEGYVSTILGRRRYLPGLRSSSLAERNAAQRLAMNTPIQGSAADIIKLAMLKLRELLASSDVNAQLVLQIHDSLVLEVDEKHATEAGRLMTEAMEKAIELSVPLKVNLKQGNSLAQI
jgi:DNA polymerase-1